MGSIKYSFNKNSFNFQWTHDKNIKYLKKVKIHIQKGTIHFRKYFNTTAENNVEYTKVNLGNIFYLLKIFFIVSYLYNYPTKVYLYLLKSSYRHKYTLEWDSI